MTSQRTVEVPVTGMHCAQCAITIGKKLHASAGVDAAEVNFGNQTARITFNPAVITPDRIEQCIVNAGFGVAAATATFHADGIESDAGAGRIREKVERLEGIVNVLVNVSDGLVSVRYNPNSITPKLIEKTIESAGYSVTATGNGGSGLDTLDRQLRREQLMRLIRLAAAFGFSLPLMVLMLTGSAVIPHNILPYVTIPVFVFVVFPIYRAAIAALMTFSLTMDVMYMLGTGTAFGASLLSTFGLTGTSHFMLYDTAVMLAGFLTLGRFLEARARGKTGDSIKKLIGLQAKTATVEVDGELRTIAVEEVAVGNIVAIKPGDKVPVDGVVVDGESTVDEAMVTGEPVPAHKKKGDPVIGGTINRSGVLRFKAERVGSETMLAHIIKMVREAQGSKPPLQRLSDTAVTWFIPVVLVIAAATFCVWFLALGASLSFALSAMIAVMVIACPCALGLASPTAVTVGIGRAAQLGILIRSGEALEKAHAVTTVVFDKTGTLTRGELAVAGLRPVGTTGDKLLRLIASVEEGSRHPLAEALCTEAKKKGIVTGVCTSFISVDGKGVAGVVDGCRVAVGNRVFMADERADIAVVSAFADDFERRGMTVVFCSVDGVIRGCAGLADTVKPDAPQAVAVLKRMGIDTVLLSGDNRRSVEAVAHQLGITGVRAEVLPKDKADEVRRLQQSGRKVAFVGDGINDAPALAGADIGIAIGSGTDVAMETAEIVLVKSSPLDAATAIQLGRKVYKRIVGNLFWAFAYNTALIPLAAGVLFSVGHIVFKPEIAAFAMAFSSVTVVTRSLMLRRFTPQNNPAAAA